MVRKAHNVFQVGAEGDENHQDVGSSVDFRESVQEVLKEGLSLLLWWRVAHGRWCIGLEGIHVILWAESSQTTEGMGRAIHLAWGRVG